MGYIETVIPREKSNFVFRVIKLLKLVICCENFLQTRISNTWLTSGSKQNIEAKLPKLHITKFNGTYAHWPRFWNLFSETIDKSGISPINKFAYLQELLCDKAKRSIEALRHTAEGYNRAISILKDRFGKESYHILPQPTLRK
jgi:hypothetical protein